jgi:alanine racemase
VDRVEVEGYFYRDTWVEVDLDCISDNIKELKSRLTNDVEIFSVVKANAYGHGDFQIANAALNSGATYLAVACLDEAISLRNKGITSPILVLGASRPENVNVAADQQITLTVFQVDWLEKSILLLKPDAKLKLHVKLDSGMGRIGMRDRRECQILERLILEDERLELEGVFTHFATADELDLTYFNNQLETFQSMLSWFKHIPRVIHASNSAAALRFAKSNFNAVRMGIAMYGLTPSIEIEEQLPYLLKEAFSLHSRLIHVKKLEAGDKVSYGATYEAQGEEWIGTIPIGYADGWIRKLQQQDVLINGKRYPLVGRICMDQCMVRLPEELPIGTKVTLIGTQEKETISINEIAKRAETINYEIPCIISNRVPRIYTRQGKTIVVHNALIE